MDQVNEVKSKVDIVNVISESVTLKKAGRNYKGLCPFHNEKTPSFMVNPELQIFKCFGCGESGDVFSFLEKYEGISFFETLKILGERTGVEIKSSGFDNATREKERLIAINEEAAKLYHYILIEHELGKEFLSYALNVRKIKRETIKVFKIGAAPNKKQVLVKHLMKKGFKKEEIVKAGIVFDANGFLMDRFYGRLVFPITDHRGRTIAMAGRILPQFDQGKSGKYINSPETLVYKKSNSLYGLSVSKQEIKKSKTAVVVEGEIDLVSAWQVGIKNIVAIKGSAFTEEQARILSRFCENVVLALDSDFAGNKAAFAGVEILSRIGLGVKIAEMGKYKDPDEFAVSDPTGLKKSIKDAENVWDYFLVRVFERYDLTSGEGKAGASREIMPILFMIEDRIVLSHYVKLVADKLNVDEMAISEQLSAFRSKGNVEKVLKKQEKQEEINETKREMVESRLLALVFQEEPELCVQIEPYVKSRFCKRILIEFKKYLKKEREYKPREFYENLPAELRQGFSKLFFEEREFNGELSRELDKIINRLKMIDVSEEMEELASLIKKAEKEGENEELASLEEKFIVLAKERRALEQT